MTVGCYGQCVAERHIQRSWHFPADVKLSALRLCSCGRAERHRVRLGVLPLLRLAEGHRGVPEPDRRRDRVTSPPDTDWIHCGGRRLEMNGSASGLFVRRKPPRNAAEQGASVSRVAALPNARNGGGAGVRPESGEPPVALGRTPRRAAGTWWKSTFRICHDPRKASVPVSAPRGCNAGSRHTGGSRQCRPAAPAAEYPGLTDRHCCCGGPETLGASWPRSRNRMEKQLSSRASISYRSAWPEFAKGMAVMLTQRPLTLQ